MTAPEALNLAIQCHRSGQLAEAESLYRQIIAAQPAHPDVPLNLGSLLHDQGRFAEAAAVYRATLAVRPDAGGVWCNLSNTLLELDQIADAIDAARRALGFEPKSFGAFNNLGNALKADKQLNQAIAAFRQSIALKPDFPFAHNNLGSALHVAGDLPGAVVCFRRAMELTPNYLEAMSNLANVLCDFGEWDQALNLCRRCLALRPDFASVHWNLGLMLLRQGDFVRGWPEYEWRWRVKNLVVPPMKYLEPRWDGGDLRGRRILIHAEQGLGDTIQFVRYVPMVADRGAKVILHFPDDLMPLLRDFPGVEQTVPWSQPLPAFDVHCPLLSLPRIFRTTVATIPSPIPYLSPQPPLVETWSKRLAAIPGRKAGLVWAGRPTHLADQYRSISLAKFAPLAGIPGWQFLSLQAGARAIDARPQGLEIADFSGELTDFGQTAALIANLDLVISVDTSVAHLAGAMGKPVWVLLPLGPDWRWMLKRPDSPWYPTLRLFRQPKAGDWPKVIAAVATALRELQL